MSKLRDASLTSARQQHTMDAESAIGMFSNFIKAFPSYDVLTCSNLIKARKNKLEQFIYRNPDEEYSKLVALAITQGRSVIDENKNEKTRIQREIDQRIRSKNVQLERTNKKRDVPFLRDFVRKNPSDFDPSLLRGHFPVKFREVTEIIKGNIVLKNIIHIWCVDWENIKFTGTVNSFNNSIYEITYYRADTNEFEEDFEIDCCDVAVDYVNKDFFFRWNLFVLLFY